MSDSEDIFDAIIVGAGLAGSVAALAFSQRRCAGIANRKRELRRRKNVTGGRHNAHTP